MSAFISRKLSFLILLAGLCTAAGTGFLLNHSLIGPRLGLHYDFFLNGRPLPPVSREILLINTSEIVEKSDIFTVLMILTEFEASDLVLEAQILESSSPIIRNEGEIRQRFNEEYALLGRNIRNLFEAIRVGSIRPAEAPGYVESLVELAEGGRDRLTSALIARDEDLMYAAFAFGALWEAVDLRSPQEGGLWYVRPRPDPDGKVRRTAPLLLPPAAMTGASVEHLVFHSLKSRWAASEIEFTENGPVLVMYQQDKTEIRIILDRDGNLIIDGPKNIMRFRRLDIERFLEYEETDRDMRSLLKAAESMGAFSQTMPERIPLFLYDHAAGLREELLKNPDPLKRTAWIRARAGYFESLEEFLYSPAETALVNGYEEIIAAERLNEEGLARLRLMRDELINAFFTMREKYWKLSELRSVLSEELAASYCIMGPDTAGGPVEISALLANALLTGSHIRPGQNRYILFWSLGTALVIIICIYFLRPTAFLITGLLAPVLCAAVFGWSFAISGYWIDPLIASGSCFAGAGLMFCIKTVIICRGARRFRTAYGPAVSQPALRNLISEGRPLVSEKIVARAVILALKDSSLLAAEDREDPLEAAQALAQFRAKARQALFDAGAVIIGHEGAAILASFGSPLERFFPGNEPGAALPENKTAGLINELLQDNQNWRLGIDSGECVFSWSPETGYTANGRPVVRARFLLSMTARFNVRVIITDSVRENINLPVRRLGALNRGGKDSEKFYELLVENKEQG